MRAEDDPSGVEVLGVGLVGRSAEDVNHAADARVLESGSLYESDVLLHEERAGDSTGPEIDVGDGIGRQRLLHHDVSYLQASSRDEHSMDFCVDGKLVRT